MLTGCFVGVVAAVLCQMVFTNSLSELNPRYASEVDPQIVINAGSTKVREATASDQLAGFMVAYAKSIDRKWHFDAAIAALAFVFGWF